MKISMTKIIEDGKFEAEIKKVSAFGIAMDCNFECDYSWYYDAGELSIDIDECRFIVGDYYKIKASGSWCKELAKDVEDEVIEAIRKAMEERT